MLAQGDPLEAIIQPFTSTFGVSFIVLVVLPALVIVVRLQSVIRVRRRAFERDRRYRTYVVLERAWREMKNDTPIAQEFVLSASVMAEPDALRVYNARPRDEGAWGDKVMITHLLEKLERLAKGVQIEVIDAHVWQGMSGHDLTTLCASLRNYIRISEEHRKGRYSALLDLEKVFLRLEREATLAKVGSAPTTRPLAAAR